MWCWTQEESRDWCKSRCTLDSKNIPTLPLPGEASTSIPLSALTASETQYLSEFIVRTIRPDGDVLLWVTLSGVFDDNPHLFYKLRESYGERRILHDAPGHYFLRYEFADLGSFIFLSLLYQWDFYVFTDFMNIFATHDGFLDVYSDQETIALFEKRWKVRK